MEPKFWEISEPLPSIVLDIPLRKENKETKFTKFESKIGPLEEEILQMKIRKNLELVVYSRKLKSLEEVKTT